MKSAKEWVEEYHQHRLEFPRDPKWRFSNGEVIRAIQLDAMKEGMRRAASVVKNRGGLSIKTSCQHHADAIITAAEQLAEKDL